ncbi:dsDNA nuclease domain-containing protein [Agreia bicolorata]|uniref:CD-NTase associated protein 4-like DNA endonuclease domain-containing protein n=1 Tax=Agreia bicolorata TaxID=110935 RepID=A0ABR5CGX6_9MICO|nr:hypothetical protein [Agreia bicolorata]KJC64894.1 hypothetical protein TZ00_04395 [Agreia bicolorata]
MIPSVPVDATQTGARTRARFRYQDRVIALTVIRLLNEESLESVLVEYGTDVTLEYIGGDVELVSIKSRDPHQQGSIGWTWDALKKQHVLHHLYQLWRTHPQVKTTVYSEAPLQGDAVRLTDPATKISPEMLSRVAKHIEASKEEAAAFLCSFAWGPPTPRDSDLLVIAEQQTRRYLEKEGRDPSGAVAACQALIEAIEHASTGDPRRNPSGRPTRRQVDDAPSVLAQARRLTAKSLRVIVLSAAEEATKKRARLTSSPTFVGHPELITDIVNALRDGQTCALVGPPGAGKTSIAFEVAARSSPPWAVHFIDASGATELALSLASFTGVSPESDAPLAQTAAFPGDGADLLIIDGVTDPEVIAPYLRATGAARVLITSTSSRLTANVTVFPVEGLSAEDTFEYLSKNWPDAVDLAEDLYRETHGNALALSQASGTARLAGLSPEVYLQTLATSPVAALSLRGERPSDHTVAKSIMLALQVLQTHSPQAFDLLTALSVFGNGPVDVSRFADNTIRVFLPGRDFLEKTFLQSQPPTTPLLETLRDPAGRAELTAALVAASHVRCVGESVLVHPLVRRLNLATADDLTIPLELAIGSFDIFGQGTPRRGGTFDELRLIDGVLARCTERGILGPAYYRAAQHASLLLSSIGARDRALELAVEAHDWVLRSIAKGQAPDEMRFFADNAYALSLSSIGNHDESAQLLLRSVEDINRKLTYLLRKRWITRIPPKDANTTNALAHAKLEAVAHLVRIAAESGDASLAVAIQLPSDEEAEQWPGATERATYWTARARWEWFFGDPDAATIAAHNAVQLVRDGRVRRDVAAEALAVASGKFHNQDPQVRASLAEEVLSTYTQEFGDGAKDTIEYIVLLTESADAHIDNGDTVAARRVVEEAHQLWTESFADDKFLYGRVLAARGRLALTEAIHEAESVARVLSCLVRARVDLRTAVTIAAEMPGRFPTDRASILINYATTLGYLESFPEAIEAAELALELDRQRFAEGHPEITTDKQVLEGLHAMRATATRL